MMQGQHLQINILMHILRMHNHYFYGEQSIYTRAILANKKICMHDFFFGGGHLGGHREFVGGTCPPPPQAPPPPRSYAPAPAARDFALRAHSLFSGCMLQPPPPPPLQKSFLRPCMEQRRSPERGGVGPVNYSRM